MSRISLINKSIEVLHPGNIAQYNQQNTEYGVSIAVFTVGILPTHSCSKRWTNSPWRSKHWSFALS
jgi:hypothetical protein